ncbi:hypothetical protein H6P81_020779 [Aristolochia fimbriata]|uniref:Uncharacterized protein n=1 Tax=Aristolochia fimbriata TaxID=158543 RepID=A0AAV7DVP4_ARIFI|nr:hypothetical protein H6P81_020779 [Aristolochia fimbriata]
MPPPYGPPFRGPTRAILTMPSSRASHRTECVTRSPRPSRPHMMRFTRPFPMSRNTDSRRGPRTSVSVTARAPFPDMENIGVLGGGGGPKSRTGDYVNVWSPVQSLHTPGQISN